jgi:hypothetical protein
MRRGSAPRFAGSATGEPADRWITGTATRSLRLGTATQGEGGTRGPSLLVTWGQLREHWAEKAAVRRHGARCFYFTRGDLPAEVSVERILANLEAITRACTEAGPFIYVHPNRIERMAP